MRTSRKNGLRIPVDLNMLTFDEAKNVEMVLKRAEIINGNEAIYERVISGSLALKNTEMKEPKTLFSKMIDLALLSREYTASMATTDEKQENNEIDVSTGHLIYFKQKLLLSQDLSFEIS
jgi:hypothetical protein